MTGERARTGLRVLMLSDFFRPIIGGLELHVERLARALVERGHEVAVATLQHEGSPAFEQADGVRIYRIQGTVQRASGLFSQAGRRFAPPAPDPEALWALRRIIERERPQIIHAHSWIVHSLLPLKGWSGAKLLLTLHDYSLRCPTKTLLYHDTMQCNGPSLGKCLSCSAHHYGPLKATATSVAQAATAAAARATIDRFIPVSRAVAAGSGLLGSDLPYQVIPNFIPDELPRLSAEAAAPFLAQLPTDGFLLFVGALNKHKGVKPLLNAYRQLAGAPPLVLLGATQGYDVSEYPDNVVSLSDWPHAAVMEAWRRCGIALVPSIWAEPCPTVVMEAMASEKPVIASRVGGIPDLVADITTGLLVPPDDSDALGRAISLLLKAPQLARQMGRAGRERVRQFQASNVVAAIEAAYRDVLPASA